MHVAKKYTIVSHLNKFLNTIDFNTILDKYILQFEIPIGTYVRRFQIYAC